MRKRRDYGRNRTKYNSFSVRLARPVQFMYSHYSDNTKIIICIVKNVPVTEKNRLQIINEIYYSIILNFYFSNYTGKTDFIVYISENVSVTEETIRLKN